jgi:hypothetical protein
LELSDEDLPLEEDASDADRGDKEASAANDCKARYECGAVSGKLIRSRYAPSLDYSPEGRPVAVEPLEFGFCAKTRSVDGRDGAVQRGEIQPGTPLPVLSMSLPNTVRPKVRSKHLSHG